MSGGAVTGLLMAGLIMLAPVSRAAELVSFSRDIVPVLRSQCATCHMSGDEPGGMKLYPSAAYRSLVEMPSTGSPLRLVSPGDPQASYLLHKLQGTHLDAGGTGVQMPFAQAPLPDETRELIRRWVAQGALDN